ncbi:MAG: haloacid dehalogenase-like hydrolase [Nitrospirae bacterium]|nr:haloacid dehalogenase-like hydrolase [Nitrospirota bacterium]
MVIGLDLDNTLASYDALFHRLALERGWISSAVAVVKDEVRNALRAAGREDDWTRLQGEVYGIRMGDAVPFPGSLEFVRACLRRGIEVYVLSHRTRRPYDGPDFDLHQAARRWLMARGFVGEAREALEDSNLVLAETKAGKIAAIREKGCTHFVDDLPEFLLEPGFQADVMRILFDPAGRHVPPPDGLRRIGSWHELEFLLWGAPTAA